MRVTLRGPSRWMGDDSGAELVEFAFCAMVFLIVVLGTMDYGRMIYVYNIVSRAARDGARYASVRGSSSGHAATADDVKTYASGRALGWLTTSDITVTWPTNNKPGSTVQVQAEYTFTPIVPIVPQASRHLSSTTKMTILR